MHLKISRYTFEVYLEGLREGSHVVQVLYVSMSTAYLLSCPFPLSPENGGVTVTDIHPGGQAHFHCDPGFQVRGHEVATCVNATVPRWSTAEPQCVGQYHGKLQHKRELY